MLYIFQGNLINCLQFFICHMRVIVILHAITRRLHDGNEFRLVKAKPSQRLIRGDAMFVIALFPIHHFSQFFVLLPAVLLKRCETLRNV